MLALWPADDDLGFDDQHFGQTSEFELQKHRWIKIWYGGVTA